MGWLLYNWINYNSFFFVFFNIGHVKKKYGSPFSGYNFTEKVNKMGAC